MIFHSLLNAIKTNLQFEYPIIENQDLRNHKEQSQTVYSFTAKPETITGQKHQYQTNEFKQNNSGLTQSSNNQSLHEKQSHLFPEIQINSYAKPIFFQIFQSYIVIQGTDGLYLLDQHAVHERILYEKLKISLKADVSQQMLLFSQVIELQPQQYQIYIEHREFFANLKFNIEDFGNNQIIIRQVPSIWIEMDIKTFFLDVLNQLQLFSIKNISSEDFLPQWEQIACKAAIKAGKKLSDVEIQQLITDFLLSPNNYTCPHGRPLFIRFSRKELDILFKR